MTGDVRFFSSLQTGLVTQLDLVADENGCPPEGAASVQPEMRVSGIDRGFSQSIELRGPGDVMRLDPAAVRATEPAPGDSDVAPNFFPYVELADATLPWMFTPARPNPNGRLMPWMVLVVVPKSKAVALSRLASQQGMMMSISGGAGAMLPDLRQAHAWAHVEDRSGIADAGRAFATRPDRFIARLMCPIHMQPGTAYIAALVPAFEAGRQAGLGRDVTETSAALAWTAETEALDLPVFHHWDFVTGTQDFEALVRRLKGIAVDETVGMHDLDLAEPRGGLDAARIIGKRHEGKPILVSYQGALVSPVARPRAWADAHRKPFEAEIRKAISPEIKKPSARSGYRATEHDPVITAPVYGTFQKDKALFDSGKSRWMNEANLDPRNRANSGLGARTIRKNQENLMGKAWARARGIEEVQTHLRTTRVALSVGIKVHERLSRLSAPQYLQATTALQSKVRVKEGQSLSVADQLDQNPSIADGVFSATFRRAATTTQVKVKSLSQAPTAPFTLQMAATQTTLSGRATVIADNLPNPDIGARPTRDYTFQNVTLNPNLSLNRLADQVGLNMQIAPGRITGIAPGGLAASPPRIATLSGTIGAIDRAPRVMTRMSKSVAGSGAAAGINSAATKQVMERATQPTRVLPDLVVNRIEGLARPPSRQVEIPRTAQVTTSFPEPAYEFLRSNGAEFLLPGFGAIEDHSVSMLHTNTGFIETYLLGLNHEMSREFAWRQFPAALNGTWFQTFWNYVDDPNRTDITPIAKWRSDRRLGGAAKTEDAVILVKSPLFRRYPDTLVYAVPARWVRLKDLPKDEAAALDRTGQMADSGKVRIADYGNPKRILYPQFTGRLGASAAFFGFDRDPLSLVGTPTPQKGSGDAGYFIVFEQAPTNQKFGLDQPTGFTPRRAPASADDLSWGHFAASQEMLDQLAHATTAPEWADRKIDEARWGRTAAETAKLALQSPVRIMFHASGLMQSGAGAA